MVKYTLYVEYEGKVVGCTYTSVVSEISCVVSYEVCVAEKDTLCVEFTTEGDSGLIENYSSAGMETGLKEAIRKALYTAIKGAII